MATYVLPEFNLVCGIWAGPYVSKVHRADVMGNLSAGRRVYNVLINWPPNEDHVTNQMVLLLPALTDIRDCSCLSGDSDVVEVPAGSGRWYGVLTVDDVGKGFPNEHRYACISKIWEGYDPVAYPGLIWPTPIT